MPTRATASGAVPRARSLRAARLLLALALACAGCFQDWRLFHWRNDDGDARASDAAGDTGADVGEPGGFEALQIAAGNGHTCALTPQRQVYCWGDALYGQIGGSGDTVDVFAPLLVPLPLAAGASVEGIAAGRYHTCAWTQSGAVYCWGQNSRGQLGVAPAVYGLIMTLVPTPVQVPGLRDEAVVEVVGGHEFTCARAASGRVFCWGANERGQLGRGDAARHADVAPVLGLEGATAVAAGSAHACAVVGAGAAARVMCWGAAEVGQADAGAAGAASCVEDTTSLPCRPTPVEIAGMRGATLVAAGERRTCVGRADGAVLCWGANESGQLGDGTTASRPTPRAVASIAGSAQVVLALAHSCARAPSGAVRCWGANDYGQLGRGDTRDVLAPDDAALAGLAARRIAVGGRHTCAIRATDGRVVCWGDDSNGQLATGRVVRTPLPQEVAGAPAMVRLRGGTRHTCGQTADGAIYCWGNNIDGRAGVPPPRYIARPTRVASLDGVGALASLGLQHGCAIDAAGGDVLRCWGASGSGQVTPGSRGGAAPWVASTIAGLSVAGVAAGAYHTCALTTGAQLACWGDNDDGQLGASSPSPPRPFMAPLSSPVRGVAAGVTHTCALVQPSGSNPQVYCWGDDRAAFGVAGSGRVTSTPTQVAGLASQLGAVREIAAGGYHNCAVDDRGAVACWGRNDFNQTSSGLLDSGVGPTRVASLAGPVSRVALGLLHSCALLRDGTVACWGRNLEGQLGDGSDAARRAQPVALHFGEGAQVTDLAASERHTCAIGARAGQPRLWCWGTDTEGQLGLGREPFRTVPTAVISRAGR